MTTKLIVIGPSKIHGTGVFAGADLPAGLFVPIPFRRCNPEKDDCFEGGYMPRVPFRFLNHSARPNCEVGALYGDDLYLTFLRRVKAGTELTIDYGDGYWEAM